MIDFTGLEVGDYVEVEYTEGDRMKGGQIRGTVTRIWRPEDTENERRKGFWQGQVNNGWCFHRWDNLLKHDRPDTPTTED